MVKLIENKSGIVCSQHIGTTSAVGVEKGSNMLCPCALLAVLNAWLWQCCAGAICSQCIQSILKE